MMHRDVFPLRTERLLLRPLADGDLPRLYEILADPEVMQLALYERPLSSEEADAFIESSFSKDVGDPTHLGVLCRYNDPRPIGFAGLLPCKYFPDDLEIGFVLAAGEHGRGYATEIAHALVVVALRALHRTRLLGLCDPQNTASRHVLEKIGMAEVEEIETPDRGRRVVYAIRAA